MIERTVTDAATSALQSSDFNIYSNGQVVLEYDTTSSVDVVKSVNLWGANIDELVAVEQMAQSVNDNNVILWAYGDHLNSIRDVVLYDSIIQTATVVNHLIYNAFGILVSSTNAAANPTTISPLLNYRYTGKFFDDSTGLQNNINRWYDNTTGKWISVDPIGFNGGDANLYRYVGNNSLLYIDSNGHAFFVIDLINNKPGPEFLDIKEVNDKNMNKLLKKIEKISDKDWCNIKVVLNGEEYKKRKLSREEVIKLINHEKKSFIKYLKNGDISNFKINYTNIMEKMFDTELLKDYEIMINIVDVYALVIHSTIIGDDCVKINFPALDLDKYNIDGLLELSDNFIINDKDKNRTLVDPSYLKGQIQDIINDKKGLFILATCFQSKKYSEIRFRPREAEGDYDEKSKTIYITTGSYYINGIYPPPSIPEIEIRPRKNVRGGKKSVK